MTKQTYWSSKDGLELLDWSLPIISTLLMVFRLAAEAGITTTNGATSKMQIVQ